MAQIPLSVSQLFRTNSVLSPADTQHVLRSLEECKARLVAFDGEIERARAHVGHLECQRDQMLDIVHELQALISPIRRMPTDVMANVFEHCIWDSADSRLSLGQVCRSWRHLLLSLPCLWTVFQLDLPSRPNEALVRSTCLSMRAWLSRSKVLPISLILSYQKGCMIFPDALAYLDAEISSLSFRLKEIALNFPSRSLSSLLSFTQERLPYLQHLELRNSDSLPGSEDSPPLILRSAPNLTSLNLSWPTLDLISFQVPWIQLRHLTLEYDSSSFWGPVHGDYLQTLACCPNLTTLSLGIGALIHNVDPTHITPVTLPHVHTFKASIYVQTRYTETLFDALRMPQLRHFDFKNAGHALGDFTGHTECLPFLVQCAGTLESVCFEQVDIADSAVLACLTQLRRLKTLSFLPGIPRLNHGLVVALTHEDVTSEQSERILPALEVLHLRCSSVVSVDAILATFEYGSDRRDNKIEEVQARLRTYVEKGLELVLTKTSNSG